MGYGRMKKRRKRIVWTIVLIFVLYFFLPLPFITEKQEIAIQENAFRSLYDSEHYGRKERLKTFYVEVGEGGIFDSFGGPNSGPLYLEEKDPSGQLLSALNDFPIEVKPVSVLHKTDPNDVIVAYRERDERAIFFGVGPIVKSLGLARCRTLYDGGGLCMAEFESFFVWTPFGWKHLFSFMLWVS